MPFFPWLEFFDNIKAGEFTLKERYRLSEFIAEIIRK